jgi:hypothetical protein
MKKIIILSIIIPLLLILINGCSAVNYTYSNNDPENAFPELDFYGNWINIKPWGEVWKPDAVYDWSPFTNGQWQYTDRGWMWDSAEPYGWIVYHYGDWAYTDSEGWIWIPGYEWYPSRVEWMQEGDYIGWCPLPPDGWDLPAYYNDFGSNVWTIVHRGDFDNPDVGTYRIQHNSFNDRRNWVNHAPDPGIIQNENFNRNERLSTRTEHINRGQHNLIRVTIMNHRRENSNTAQSANSQNYNPPENRREQNRQQAARNARSNSSERSAKPRSR